VNIEIDFPETLEDILVWKLENSDLTDSYHMDLWGQHGMWFSSMELHTLLKEWLRRIAKLNTIVTYRIKTQLYESLPSRNRYYASVAGVYVCVLNYQEKDEIFGVTHD
jgi:hypothetical protein